MRRAAVWLFAVAFFGLALMAPQDASAFGRRHRVRYTYRGPAVRVKVRSPRVYVAPPVVPVAPPVVPVYPRYYYGPRVVTPWVTVW
jgi:hypothetical protein